MTKTTNITMKHILILTTLLFALPNMLCSAERLPGQHILPDAQYRRAGARGDAFHRHLRGVRGLFIDLCGAMKLRPIKGQKLRQMLEGAKVERELKSYIDDSAKNRLLIHGADITLFQKHLRAELEAIKKAVDHPLDKAMTALMRSA